MGIPQTKTKAWDPSAHRVAAMAVAISVHIGLIALLLRPAADHREALPPAESDAPTLKLRFIERPRAATAPPVRASLLSKDLTSGVQQKQTRTVPAPSRPSISAAAPFAAPTSTRMPPAQAVRAAPTPPNPYTSETPATDGGFAERLRNAQHAYDVHGVPGSDKRFVQGIQLTDPMNQGIGSLARRVQRLFGVPNHHCIDVDVWQNLSVDELIARHLTRGDVEKENQKYQCNRPLGLSI